MVRHRILPTQIAPSWCAAALVSAADRNKSVRIKNVTDLKFLMHSLLPWILNGSLIAAAVFIHYETL